MITTEFVHEHRVLLALAEACQREHSQSYSWHVFDWMAWKLRCKYPLVQRYPSISLDIDGIT